MPLSIFLSHGRKDEKTARAISAALQTRGVRVWTDQGPGEEISAAAASALGSVDLLLFLLSDRSVPTARRLAELELVLAREREEGGVRVFPLQLGRATVPASLAGRAVRELGDDVDATVALVLADAQGPERRLDRTPPEDLAREDAAACAIEEMLVAAREKLQLPSHERRRGTLTSWDGVVGYVSSPGQPDALLHESWVADDGGRPLVVGDPVMFTPARGEDAAVAVAAVRVGTWTVD